MPELGLGIGLTGVAIIEGPVTGSGLILEGDEADDPTDFLLLEGDMADDAFDYLLLEGDAA